MAKSKPKTPQFVRCVYLRHPHVKCRWCLSSQPIRERGSHAKT